MSAEERTGFRDQALSERHRTWGFDCPCVDIDFLLLEFDRAETAATVDYKHYQAEVNLASASIKAMAKLRNSDCEQIPCFIARYWPETWAFRVTPVNVPAISICINHPNCRSTDGVLDLSEYEWVNLLYSIRGKRPTFDVSGLNQVRQLNSAGSLLDQYEHQLRIAT